MAKTVSESVVRATVSRAAAEGSGRWVIALAAPPLWDGPARLDTEAGPVEVRPCASVLAVKEVLSDLNGQGDGPWVVLLTEQSEAELGTEVQARLWHNRVMRVTGWEALREQFRAEEMDPRLAEARWLVDLLVEVAPARGYPPPPSGFLDFDTAWRTFLRHGLRLDTDRPGIRDLLLWGEQDSARVLLSERVGGRVEAVTDRLPREVAGVARHIFRLVGAGRGADVVPLGLVADALWNEVGAEDPLRATARVRFEGPLGTRGLTADVARSWGTAAVELVQRAHTLSDDPTRLRWVNRAESILAAELDALGLAYASRVLPRGFDQRLEQAGGALARAIKVPSESHQQALREASTRVESHLRAEGGEEHDRTQRLLMAERLTRRLTVSPRAAAKDLATAARGFLSDGAWVDRAREAISHGETVGVLADAYGELLERVDAERLQRDRHFAELLASWSETEPGDRPPLLPVERVLEAIVAPAARELPVLFLVLDGWSHPEALRLDQDLQRAGWVRQAPEEGEEPIVVAALPSVTMVSRASLLSGRRIQGGQDVERQGWAENPALAAVSKRKTSPLFHRKDLGTAEGHIAREVRDAILDSTVQVVGVVVNAVDEHLDKGGQIRMAEGMQGIRPLRPLLEAAMEARRLVILASDHGHVLEAGSVVRPHGGSGERWRPIHPPASEDEIEIRGPRVLMDGGKIVVPSTERLRYVSVKKHGYHGGATPQEMLCPLELFLPPGLALSAWVARIPGEPSWWRERVERAVAAAPAPRPAPAPVVEASGQVQLFAGEAEMAASRAALPSWIGGLLESPVLVAQRAAAGRQALSDEDTVHLLELLEASGGVTHARRLADQLGIPLGRVTGKVAALIRVLNVDGSKILWIEGDGTVRFARGRLFEQFGLDDA